MIFRKLDRFPVRFVNGFGLFALYMSWIAVSFLFVSAISFVKGVEACVMSLLAHTIWRKAFLIWQLMPEAHNIDWSSTFWNWR